MDKKRLKAALDAVKSRFPETKEFIDDVKEECEKELQMR